jgi:hypothetical protein
MPTLQEFLEMSNIDIMYVLLILGFLGKPKNPAAPLFNT